MFYGASFSIFKIIKHVAYPVTSVLFGRKPRKQVFDIIEAFNSTYRYLDDLLNIDNPYFEGMVNQIYPPELQWNKANTSDNEAPFFIWTYIGFVSSKIYDKRDDFDFDKLEIFLFSTSSLLWSVYFSTYKIC